LSIATSGRPVKNPVPIFSQPIAEQNLEDQLHQLPEGVEEE
jgi:hypothetical protein